MAWAATCIRAANGGDFWTGIFRGSEPRGACGRCGEPARQDRPRVDGGTGVPLAGDGADCGRALAAAEGRGRVADRLFAFREDREGRRSAGPVRGVDLEPARALRFAYSGSVSVRDVFRADSDLRCGGC